MRHIKVILLSLFVGLMICPALNQAQQDSVEANGDSIVTGSLAELRKKRRVFLVIRRSNVVDSRGLAKTILNEVYKTDSDTRLRYPRLYNILARKLNNYMSKYHSISAAEDVSDAEFIIFFNLLEFRRPLGFTYPYGEMFVILNDTAGGKSPRIIWKTRKASVWAEDAMEDLIKDLKAVRGEG